MGGTARQFNKIYSDYKKQFKKPIHTIALLMPLDFSDNDFVNDSKEDVTRDKQRTESETSEVTVTGQTGNVTDAMMKEYKARLMNLRQEIIREVVSAITLEIYV